MSTCPLTGKVSDSLFICTNPHMPDDVFICMGCPAFDPIILKLFPETALILIEENDVEDEIDEIEGELE